MKQTITLVGILLAFTLCFASCGGNNSGQDTSSEVKSKVSNVPQKDLSESDKNETKDDDTFTTPQGTYNINKTLNKFYNSGVRDGAGDKSLTFPEYHRRGQGTEKEFKRMWTTEYGIPNNEKAKEVYKSALKKYIQGYDEGWNF